MPYEQIKPHISSDFNKSTPAASEDQMPQVDDHAAQKVPVKSEGILVHVGCSVAVW